MTKIKKQYTNPVPILYLCRGIPETSLVSRDINTATEITLHQQMNEVATLTFQIPFTKDRKISSSDCEKLVKFEGEYYIIKEVTLEDADTRTITVRCSHESVELKGVYCEGKIKLIGESPESIFNYIINSTRDPKTCNYKWAGTDVVDKYRHLTVEDETSVYQNLVSLAEVFNGWLEFWTDENEQKWVYLRTKVIQNHKFIRKGIDMKSMGITYNSDEIFTQLAAFGAADPITGNEITIMPVNPTKRSYVENYSYYLAKGIPKESINSEAKYQQLKVIRDDDYINPQDLYDLAVEELEKHCVPQIDATVSMTDLSVYIDNPTEPPRVGYELICIDKDIEFNIACRIDGVERNYTNPMNTLINISNVIKYNTMFQNIQHVVDEADKVLDKDSNGDTYIPDIFVKDENGVSIKVQLGDLQSSFEMTVNTIQLRVDDFERQVYSEIKMTADSITSTVADELKGVYSQIKQNADSIELRVMYGELGSLIEQKPDSVKISFNQISEYVLIDKNGLTLGNTATGDYTVVNSQGLMHVNGTTMKKYHYLTEIGSIDIAATGQDYDIATVELSELFDRIDVRDISVAVTVAKVYSDGMRLPYWFGAYGEIIDIGTGRKAVKLSLMSTWRDWDTDHVLADIDGSTTRVVTGFSSPKPGRIIARFTVVA